MDYPKSKAAELRLVGDKFADRDPGTNAPGSILPAVDWANPVTDELIGLQSLAGLAAAEGDNAQVGQAVQILARGGALGFRAKPQAPETLSLDIEGGAFFSRDTGLMVSVGVQNVGPIAAPAADPRKDIVYIDALTGVAGIAAGAEAAAPADPALVDGKLPVCRINAYVGMTEITAADLDELRYLDTVGFQTPPTPVFSESYVSPAQTITSAGALTLAHGLGTVPRFILCWAKCLVAEFGFSVGDEVLVPHAVATYGHNRFGVRVDATNLYIKYGSDAGSALGVTRQDNGNDQLLSNGNWEAYFLAFA